MEERLQKIIARAGLASRRAAERLIQSGMVKVNGEVVDRLGAKADSAVDLIEVGGRVLGDIQDLAYYMINKPQGVITTAKDPRGRSTIIDLTADLPVRVFPVGRLDMDAEGLLILTNDGALAKRLMHPAHHVPKTYRVKVRGRPVPAALRKLAAGEIIVGERPALPATVEAVKFGDDRTWIHITLTEGRYHQVKKMCSAIGHPVMRLKRIEYGPIKLGRLKPGELRELKPVEVRTLKKAVGL